LIFIEVHQTFLETLDEVLGGEISELHNGGVSDEDFLSFDSDLLGGFPTEFGLRESFPVIQLNRD